LREQKYDYAEAGGGQEAIELYKTYQPNLVFCDVQMPGVDGIEATRQMRLYEEEKGLARSRIVRSVPDSPLMGHY
jgi:CheY-like chemotaxis protein